MIVGAAMLCSSTSCVMSFGATHKDEDNQPPATQDSTPSDPATQAQGTIPTDSSYKGEGAGPTGEFMGEVEGDVVEGYKIRMY